MRAVRGQFPQSRDLWKRASMGQRVGRVSSHAVSRWSRSLGCCGFRGVLWVRRDFVIFTPDFFFFERTRPAASMRPLCLIYLSTSTGVRTGCHYLIMSLSVCCVTFVVFTDCQSCSRPISTNPGSMEAGEYGHNAYVFRRTPSRGGRGRRAAVDFVVCFGCGGIS